MSIMLAEETPRLKAARAALDEAREQRKTAAEAFETASAEETRSQEELDELETAFNDADVRVSEAKADVEKWERVARARQEEIAPAPIQVVREPLTYARENSERSFLIDLARHEFGQGMDLAGARKRLEAHRREADVELKDRREARERVFNRELDQLVNELEKTNPALARALQRSGIDLVEKRAINRVDGTGGEFVPPIWLLDEYAAFARAGRPFADRLRNIPLPAGTDSINIPRITLGGLTGIQTGDNQNVTAQDPTTATVTAPVRTIAGQIDAALQLLDQSPLAFDEIMFQDLLADYALQLDLQLWSGTGAGGQLLGILNTAGVNAITYTDATPTVPELWPKLAGALNSASNARKMVPDAFWSHGQRWFWAASQLDSNNRPFFIPASNGPQNALGLQDGSYNQDGPVTNVLAVPWYLDLNIPTNRGGGTNQDTIVATVMRDHILFEGDQNVRVLKEILSGSLGVRFQVYSYVAATFARFPAATSVIDGTGLITPSF
jgi:HK97 family phage major capsid protein